MHIAQINPFSLSLYIGFGLVSNNLNLTKEYFRLFLCNNNQQVLSVSTTLILLLGLVMLQVIFEKMSNMRCCRCGQP